MCSRETIKNLRFTHFVTASFERVIFAAARDGKRIRNFVFGINGGWAKEQVNSHFEYLPGELAVKIIQLAEQFYGRVPNYRTRTLRFS